MIYTLQNSKKLNEVQFLRYFESKVLYTIRKYNLLDKKERQEIKIEELFKKNKVGSLTISLDCLDDIALNVLMIFMAKKNVNTELKKFLPKYKNIVRPFYLVSKKEMEIYAKLKKIKQEICVKKGLNNKRTSKNKNYDMTDISNISKNSLLSLWLDEFEQEHPEVKNAIVSSLLKIDEVL
jgi:hypothetical protein